MECPRDSRLSKTLRRSRSKAALVDPQRADARLECRAGNPQPGSRSRWAEHLSATRAQRLLDDRLLVSGEFAGQRARALDHASCGQPTLVNNEFFGVADDHRALNHILQLAHVSWPWIGQKAIERLFVDTPERFMRLAGVAMNEVFHQHRNVLFPVPQGGHLQRKHVQSVKEVLAES